MLSLPDTAPYPGLDVAGARLRRYSPPLSLRLSLSESLSPSLSLEACFKRARYTRWARSVGHRQPSRR